MPTDVDALLARLTAARAGYLDNLNIGGPVASSAEATAIQNNTRVVRVTPDAIELPAAGTRTYRIELFLYDETGNMEAPDSAPTIALVNQAGTDRSSRLDNTTMALVETGRYRAVYTSTAGDTKEQLVWTFSVAEGGQTRKYGNTSYVVDAIATDFTTADRSKLDALHDNRLTAARAGYLDNLNGHTPQSGDTFAQLPGNFADLAITASTGQVTVGTNNDKAGYSISGTKTTLDALNDISAAGVNAEVVDALQTDTPVAGVSIVESLRRIGAVSCYKISGAGTGTETITDWADSVNTIVVTVDVSGNRTAVVFN